MQRSLVDAFQPELDSDIDVSIEEHTANLTCPSPTNRTGPPPPNVRVPTDPNPRSRMGTLLAPRVWLTATMLFIGLGTAAAVVMADVPLWLAGPILLFYCWWFTRAWDEGDEP